MMHLRLGVQHLFTEPLLDDRARSCHEFANDYCGRLNVSHYPTLCPASNRIDSISPVASAVRGNPRKALQRHTLTVVGPQNAA